MARVANSKSQCARKLLVDYVMFVSALGTILTGVVLWLCVGRGPDAQKFFLGWHRHEWGDLHTFFSLAFVALVLVHLILHWTWIKLVVPKQLRGRTGVWNALKATAVTTVVLGTVWACFAMFRSNAGPCGQGRRHWAERDLPCIEQNADGEMPVCTSRRRRRRGWAKSEARLEQPALETDMGRW